MISIDTLISPPTDEQILETYLSILETLSVPARSWRKGGVARSILRVVAKTQAGFVQIMAEAIKSGFLETASGGWLTLLAKNVFNVDRKEATFATGDVTISNGGGGVYAFNPDEVRFLSSSTGKAYTNTGSFTLDPAETKSIPVRAVELGAASSAPPGTIDTLETVLTLVTVTNPTFVIGADEETDADLRTACRNKLAAISVRGPRGAYAFAVRDARRLDGSFVDVNRVQISSSSSTGVVTCYVASPAGAPDPADLEFIEESIEAIARPDSVTVNVLAATEVPLTRTLTVWTRRVDGLAAADVKALVEAAIAKEIAIYPIGGYPKPPATQGYFYSDFLAGTAKGAHPAIYDIDGAGADVALAPGEVVTLALTVVVRIVEVG